MSADVALPGARPRAWIGIVLVIVGSVLLASKGIFAKLLYARGLDFETVVATRAVLAVPGFFLLALLFGGLKPLRSASLRDLAAAAFAGLVCYYVGASANFYALTLIDASVERALLFSYPAMVVVAMWFMTGSRPGLVMTAGVITTYLGIALVVGVFSRDLLQQNLTGALWVMLCSATIAYYFIVSGRLTHTLSSSGFTVVAMASSGAALAVHFQLRYGWQNLYIDAGSWQLMLALVVFATVLPLYLVAEGLRRIGVQRAAIASTVGPPAAALMAITLLGERISAGQILGIALIAGGIVALELRQRYLRF